MRVRAASIRDTISWVFQPRGRRGFPELLLDVQNLTKSYVTYHKDPGLRGAIKALFHRVPVAVEAVKPVTFQVARGEFVGLLGPNGAGKTTILKMLTGLIAPSAGRAIAFNEYNVSNRPVRYLERIGMVMGQRNQLNPDLPAIDSFRLAQAIYGVPDNEFQQRLDQMLGLFEAHELTRKPVRKLSLGERMQMEMTLSLLHGPELLFLDEPTIGLDFVAARRIRNFLKAINASLGVTVILTSHYTKDIEELCRRVILINKGTCVYDGLLSQVDERIHGQREVEILCAGETVAMHVAAAVKAHGTASPVVASKEDGTCSVQFFVTPRSVAQWIKVVTGTVEASGIVDIKISEAELETVFGELYARGV